VLTAVQLDIGATLVREAQSGSRVAFGKLYEQYAPLVHGILIANAGFFAAEDLLHDVFIKALEGLPSLREPAAFSGWLMAIARRTALDYLRARRNPADSMRLPSAAPSPEGEAFAVLELVQRLPESYRETLVLRLVEGMTGPEIAARTGLTPDSVRVNLCRGMKLLREQIAIRKKV
jgi:RNA polymerase sigma-70 factor (ECF subfamily)